MGGTWGYECDGVGDSGVLELVFGLVVVGGKAMEVRKLESCFESLAF